MDMAEGGLARDSAHAFAVTRQFSLLVDMINPSPWSNIDSRIPVSLPVSSLYRSCSIILLGLVSFSNLPRL